MEIKERVSTRGGSGSGGLSGATRLSTYACAHVLSVTEPKSLPKQLPLHTEESLDKVHPVTNFTDQSLAASLVK